MGKEIQKRGSISVFAAVSMMLIATLIFTLLEGARLCEFKKLIRMETDLAMESLFANYNSILWEEYHLLLLEENGTSEAYVRSLINESISGASQTNSLLSGECVFAELSEYAIITDGEGAAFEAAVSAYMTNNLAYELMNQIRDWYQTFSELEEEGIDVPLEMNQAIEALDAYSLPDSSTCPIPSRNINRITLLHEGEENQELGEEILRDVSEESAWGILFMMLPAGAKVSSLSIEEESELRYRDLTEGNIDIESNWYDSLLTTEYLVTYLSNYENPRENRGLKYELEYVIAGKNSDEENLTQVVSELLLLREIANYSYLLTDELKMAEVETLAGSVCTALYSPELTEVVTYGILAAWAYAESVLDVRALLQGKRIALIKNSAQWTSEVSKIVDLIEGKATAKECEGGLSYENYLSVLLLSITQKARAYRALEVMEATVRVQTQSDSFQIDRCLIEATLQTRISYPFVFLGLETLTIEDSSFYSYRKAGT